MSLISKLRDWFTVEEDDNDDSEPRVQLVQYRTLSKEYVESKGTAYFTDGAIKPLTWHERDEVEDRIHFYQYRDFRVIRSGWNGEPEVDAQKVLVNTISVHNLTSLDVESETRKTYEDTVRFNHGLTRRSNALNNAHRLSSYYCSATRKV